MLAWRVGPAVQTVRMGGVLCSEPLELEYLDTVLAGHDVTLLDGLACADDPVALARSVDAEVVLLSACITNTPRALETARRLKTLPGRPRVFLGGPHFEVVPRDGQDDAVDGVFFADALAAVATVLDRIRDGRPYEDVPGACFPTPGGWVENPGPPQDPARLPVPRRRLLKAHPDRYNYLYLRPCASVKTALGCPGGCTFCFCAEMNGGRWSPRPLDAVVEEIAGVPVGAVFLLDDDLLVDPDRVLALCDALEARGIRKRLVAYGAVRSIVRRPDVVARLAAVGLEGLVVGLESIRDQDLRAWHKGATPGDNDRALAVCRAHGVEVFALFMVDPGWRHADFWRLGRYLLGRALSFATFSTVQVFPGTRLARQAGAPSSPLWRYDLLRLHQRPAHLTRVAFYLWLFVLYLLPGMRPGTLRVLLRRYGGWGCVRLVAGSTWAGLDYLWRLVRWP